MKVRAATGPLWAPVQRVTNARIRRLFAKPNDLAHAAADGDCPFVAICDPIRGDLR